MTRPAPLEKGSPLPMPNMYRKEQGKNIQAVQGSFGSCHALQAAFKWPWNEP